MYRNEIIKCTGLSRKALDYYEEKGLISPMREENGYRIYEREDLERLKKISLLRSLDFSISEIYSYINKDEIDLSLIHI